MATTAAKPLASAQQSSAGRRRSAPAAPPVGSVLAVVSLCVALFALDFVTPRAVATGALYILPVLYAADWPRRSHFLATVIGVTTLTIVGYLDSPVVLPGWAGLSNVAISLLMIWIAALVGRQRAEANRRQAASAAERQVALEAADAERRTLHALMEFLPEGITIADAPDVRVTMVSRHGVELLQRQEDALRGPADTHPEAWRILRMDGTIPSADELPLSRAVQRGEVSRNDLWRLIRADGSVLTVSCNAGPIRGADGQVTGGVIAWRDVTEDHELQQTLHRQAEALRAHDRSKDVFLAMVAHEMRQPLNALVVASHVARGLGSDERLRGALTIVDRQVGQLARLVSDLTDAARLRQGKFSVDLRQVDFAAAVRHGADTARSVADGVDVRFEVVAPPGAVMVLGDEARLRQVVVNLATNAVRHTPSKGTVTLTLACGTDTATLSVCDTGAGIDASLLPHVFDLFVQGADSGNSGMGLGLAIAKGIVDLHHGAIEASSAGTGRGAEFRVTLPLASAGLV